MKLTREEIEGYRKFLRGITNPDGWVDALCDAALQSLSQEAVRDEALDLVINRLGKEYVGEGDTAHNAAVGYCIGAVIALKREPNAAAQAGESSGKSDSMESPAPEPAPAAPALLPERFEDLTPQERELVATAMSRLPKIKSPAAPDVAKVIEQLHAIAEDWQDHFHDTKSAGYWVPMKAAALLARLGQAQSPFVVNWTTEGCPKHHGLSWTMGSVPIYTEIAKRCPLCEPAPGASDE